MTLLAFALLFFVFLAAGVYVGNRRLRHQLRAALSVAEQFDSLAAHAQAQRDHAVWELGNSQRLLAEVISDRDKAVRVLLSRIERQEQDGAAAVEVALTRLADQTARLAEHLATAAVSQDTAEMELQQILEAGKR